MKQITVLLADDHMIVREGLRMLLEAESDIEVVGEADNGRQAVEIARKLRPAGTTMKSTPPATASTCRHQTSPGAGSTALQSATHSPASASAQSGMARAGSPG